MKIQELPARWAVPVAAAMSGYQAFLWAKVQFWSAMVGAAVLAVVLVIAAFVARSRLLSESNPESGRSGGLRVASFWSLVVLLSVMCFLPIRAGALQSRSIERAVLVVLACTALLALLMAFQSIVGAALRRRGLRNPVLLLPGVVLLSFLAADVMRLARPSGLSALACTGTLFRGKPDTAQLLAQHHEAIARQSALHDLPGALVAAVMVDHQNQQSSSGDLVDCLGSAMGVNLSLGLAQVRLGTAAELDGSSLANLSVSEYRKLRSRLLNPESNIAYEARELRALMERPIRFPGMSASALLHDPAAMALLVSEYRRGRMPSSADKSRLYINAFSTLGLMQDETLARFDKPEQDPVRARVLIREYLDHIYCRSGLFNAEACTSYRRVTGN
jgi:hypothetical protein